MREEARRQPGEAEPCPRRQDAPRAAQSRPERTTGHDRRRRAQSIHLSHTMPTEDAQTPLRARIVASGAALLTRSPKKSHSRLGDPQTVHGIPI